jgi:uncharacterized protein (TIGR03663 family)
MNGQRLFAITFLAICGLAIGLRAPHLNRRPMHGDEAVHAVRWEELRQTGRYVYDPYEYHGPTLYYATFPAALMRGFPPFAATDAAMYRSVPVAFGVGSVLLLLLLTPALGRPATVAAALLTAVSPAMVFYSRYYIQETLLVFFTLLAIAAGWRGALAATTRRRGAAAGWSILLGAALGCMQATKETCIIVVACLVTALTVALAAQRRTVSRLALGHALRAAAWALPVAVAVSVLLFAGPGGHWSNVVDSFRAYRVYIERAGGGIHTQPWYYYLNLLLYTRAAPGPAWSEALIVMSGLLGAAVTFGGRRAPARATSASPELTQLQSLSESGLARFLAIYTFLLLAVYSAIPYKTPWCVLGPLHGLILLAGIGIGWLWNIMPGRPARAVLAVAFLAGAGHLAWQAWRGSHDEVFCTDPRNPYVYAHPVRDVERLAEDMERLAQVHPAGRKLLIRVIAPNPWPLPWYLRAFPHVGYYEQVPADADADVIVVSTAQQSALEAVLRKAYDGPTYRGLRRDEILAIYVRRPEPQELECDRGSR